jgi:hypothetical protein
MRSPIEFEKALTYDRCRESIDSDDYPRPNSIDEAEESLTKESEPAPPPPPYSAFSINRRRFILGIVTAAGFFGPLCGAVYLPSLRLFQTIFKTSETAINGTVSMYMVVFAVAVCMPEYQIEHHTDNISLFSVRRRPMLVGENLSTLSVSAAFWCPTLCLQYFRHILRCFTSSEFSRALDPASCSLLEQVLLPTLLNQRNVHLPWPGSSWVLNLVRSLVL